MRKTVIEKIEYKGWENCIKATNGIIELIATTDVGPRIIHFGFAGGKNELCEVEAESGKKGGDEWRIYGGHRLWHSPEDDVRSYEPDNSKIESSIKNNTIILSQPVEPVNRIEKDMEISISPDKASIRILHRLTNKGVWDVKLAAWALTVMATGGKEIIPQVLRDAGVLPNRMLSLWSYTRLNDHRVTWGEKYITLQQDKDTKHPFKIGLPNEAGWAAYANGGNLFIKRFNYFDNVEYPDFSASSYETYTTDFMLEMETLSPLKVLKPGEYLEHTETWHLFDKIEVPQNESDVDRIILPLVEDCTK